MKSIKCNSPLVFQTTITLPFGINCVLQIESKLAGIMSYVQVHIQKSSTLI